LPAGDRRVEQLVHHSCESADVARQLGPHVAGHLDGFDVGGDRTPPAALGRDIWCFFAASYQRDAPAKPPGM
jgi:hypothetical protein